jgi:small GTP-binding protein
MSEEQGKQAGQQQAAKKKISNNNQITELERQISETKYNKKTESAIGLMKAKLSKLKEKEASRGKGQKKGDGYTVRKSGNATVVLLGLPSVGKSTLLNALTNAQSEVAAYAFTTLTCIPGTMEHKSAKIQILDVPGIVEGAARGTGRGKEVLQVIRSADLVLMVIDVFNPEQYELLLKEVYESGVRLNQRSPNVKITKTPRGGIDIGSTVKLTKLNHETIKGIMKEMGVLNAFVVFREDINADQLIDVLNGNCVYTKSVVCVNKIDLASQEQLDEFKKRGIHVDVAISAQKKEHIEELKDKIYEGLEFIRIYMKEVGKKPDMDVPLIIKSPCTLHDVCEKIHRDFVSKFKFARIWGSSVKFSGQKVINLKHEVKDGDVVELHLR